MSTPPSAPEPTPPRKPAGLWGRLRGAFQAMATCPPPPEELTPGWDSPAPVADFAADLPTAAAVPTDGVSPEAPIAEAVPQVEPVDETHDHAPADAAPESAPSPADSETTEQAPAAEPHELPPEALPPCPACHTPRTTDSPFCRECGFLFPAGMEPTAGVDIPELQSAGERWQQRYEVLGVLSRTGTVTRLRAIDHGVPESPTPVVLVRMRGAAELAKLMPPAPRTTSPESGVREQEPEAQIQESEIRNEECPADRIPESRPLTPVPESPISEAQTLSVPDFGTWMNWPGIAWEWSLLERCKHVGLPRVLNHFAEGDAYVLAEEALTGRPLWDAWDDPAATPAQRFTWLAEVAEELQELHRAGAILEGLRPESVVIKPDGHAAIADLSDLLPLPLPSEPPIKATPYTAPELILDSKHADARADLYSFGAMMYALYLGRELTELDFERQGVPKPFVFQFPDVHPLIGRILMKTFVREPDARFPTEQAFREDATGFTELIQMLRLAAESLDQVRLDIAGWTNIGLLRTSNEDAFALLHVAGGRANQLDDRALIILADGMGGEEAGEVAAAMAIDGLWQRLRNNAESATTNDETTLRSQSPNEETLIDAIREVNREIFDASRTPGKGRRGMGCTVEVVFIDGRRVVLGHVGDSRTYHYTGGRLTQLTRDQTLVNRLVELGQLTPKEAENHPRKNELQQALGSVPQVDPDTAHADLQPRDWIVICSDGLTNHVDDATLTEMIERADSAEMLARRLVNLANLKGGSDNCTVVAARAT